MGDQHRAPEPALDGDPAIAQRVATDMRAATEHVARTLTHGPVAIVELRSMPRATLPRPSGPEIPRAAMTLSASHNAAALPLAVDGNDATRWLSGTQQDGTEWIQIAFDHPAGRRSCASSWIGAASATIRAVWRSTARPTA